jgi:hypothetical protein
MPKRIEISEATIATVDDLLGLDTPGQNGSRRVYPVRLVNGATTHVRIITLGELEHFTKGQRAEQAGDFRRRIIAACACAPDGTPFFSLDDLGRIEAMHAGHASRIFSEACRVNCFNEPENQELKNGSGEITESN